MKWTAFAFAVRQTPPSGSIRWLLLRIKRELEERLTNVTITIR